jgi:hypothetical protein
MDESLSSQNNSGNLGQVCRTVICPLQHLARPVTLSLQSLQAVDIKVVVDKTRRGELRNDIGH